MRKQPHPLFMQFLGTTATRYTLWQALCPSPSDACKLGTTQVAWVVHRDSGGVEAYYVDMTRTAYIRTVPLPVTPQGDPQGAMAYLITHLRHICPCCGQSAPASIAGWRELGLPGVTLPPHPRKRSQGRTSATNRRTA